MIFGGAALPLLLLFDPAHATVPNDLCSGDPCVITTSNVTVDAGSVLDFGARSLAIAGNVTLRLGPGTSPRVLTLKADQITLQAGARIFADPSGSSDDGTRAVVTLQSMVGDVVMQSSGTTRSEINVKADNPNNEAGSIVIDAMRDALLNGLLYAIATGADGTGGEIVVEAKRQILISQEVSVAAEGSFSGGGLIDLLAGGDVTVSDKLLLDGGSFSGGDLTVIADGSVTFANIVSSNAGNPDGEAGETYVTAGGDITVTSDGLLRGQGGSGPDEDCGDGMSVTLEAGRHVVIDGDFEVKGGFQCDAGDLFFDARLDFVQGPSSNIVTSTGGAYGGSGFIDINGGRSATVGSVDGSATGFAADVTVIAPHSIDVYERINARGSGSIDSFGGRIELQSCSIDIQSPDGVLDARSVVSFPKYGIGVNVLKASGQATVSGALDATDANLIRYRTLEPTLAGSIDPAATVVQDDTLPECGYCGDGVTTRSLGEVCDDGNTQSCDGCAGYCQRIDAVCGDRIVECGEQCDDGNTTSGDGCNSDCTIGPIATPTPIPTPSPVATASPSPGPTPTPTSQPTPSPTPSFPSSVVFVEETGLCGGNTPCYAETGAALAGMNNGGEMRIAADRFGTDVTIDKDAQSVVVMKGGWTADFVSRISGAIVIGAGSPGESTFASVTIRGGIVKLR